MGEIKWSHDATEVPMVAEAAADEWKRDEVLRCARDFRHFLHYWHFVDKRTGKVTCMGDGLWEGQEILVSEMENYPWVYSLKARQLGITEVSTAFDAWRTRFGPTNARVHLFSRRDDEAVEMLNWVKAGMKRLPEWMQLPPAKQPNTHELFLAGGPDDVRLCKAFPTGKDTGVGLTCIHAHIDELARMEDPERTWQAIEASCAGTVSIMTTGLGPENYSGRLWRLTLSGDTEFRGVFIDALKRPDRDEAWLARKRAELSETHFRQEYPLCWEDALFGGGDFQFPREDLDRCCDGGGPEAPEAGHRYSIGWDIGRHRDAAVGIVLDATRPPYEVVHYERHRGKPYPFLQARIENQWREYGGPRCRLLVEKNGPGEAVLENLNLPERVVEESGFSTTKPSKAKIIENLTVLFQNRGLLYSARAWPQLDSELRGYTVPDDNVTQDSVMALAIAASESYAATGRGRIRAVIKA